MAGVILRYGVKLTLPPSKLIGCVASFQKPITVDDQLNRSTPHGVVHHFECPQLAQMRSANRARKCLLFGVDRTYRGHHETDAFDPKRTWHTRLLNHLVGAGEERRRKSNIERHCRLGVDHDLELGRLFEASLA
jgi:hypothetical protein